MKLYHDWAEWLARDEDDSLWAYSVKPLKGDNGWSLKSFIDDCIKIEETDDTFKHIKWTDEEPTNIKRGLEAGGVSTAELNHIMNAKAHGYDEVPEVADKTERVYVVKDGTKITVDETSSISFEEAMTLVENRMETDTDKDMVNKPNHYVGIQGLEVETVLQNFIPRYKDSYEAHRIASAIEYLLRSPLKNGTEDVKKAKKNIEQVLSYREMLKK